MVASVASSALASGAAAPRPLGAQSPAGAAPTSAAPRADRAQPTRTVTADTPDATREELVLLLESTLKQSTDATAKAAARDQANSAVATIRQRLEAGDFRVGDRFLATIVADSVRRAEFVVRDGPSIDLTPLPVLSLQGVLRAELQAALRRHLATYFRNPEVRIDFLTRITVSGAVAKPGVVALPLDALVNDIIAAAGGPTLNARTDKTVIVRGGKEILDRKEFQRAIREGTTIAQLDLHPGDEVRVAERGRRNWQQIATISMLGMTAMTAILSLIRSSYSD